MNLSANEPVNEPVHDPVEEGTVPIRRPSFQHDLVTSSIHTLNRPFLAFAFYRRPFCASELSPEACIEQPLRLSALPRDTAPFGRLLELLHGTRSEGGTKSRDTEAKTRVGRKHDGKRLNFATSRVQFCKAIV
jgi:hypothetical protein